MNIADGLHDAYEEGYAAGQWDMFERITTAYEWKQVYFPQDDGTIYSRKSCEYLKDMEEAVKEWINKEFVL